MRKILFIIPEYSHGGTNKSLENLLSLIDKTKYDISIYCLYEDGGDYYKRLFAPFILQKSRLYYWLHDNVLTRKVMGLVNKLSKKDNFGFLYKREALWLQKKWQPDVVVGFQEGTSTLFASFFPKTVNRIAWYHCPYIPSPAKADSFVKLYREFDSIVCVSNTFLYDMRKYFPQLESKFITIYNLLDTSKVIDMSKEEICKMCSNKSGFKILSVGRFAPKSQFHLIPRIVHDVLQSCHKNFKWYIIASGDECEQLTREEIEKYQVRDNVILLGAKDNPYPYIKAADLVACTSNSESFSYVIAEAKVLHTPVLSNDFPVAIEVVDESCGWIANVKDMPSVLSRIIDNVDGEYDRKKEAAMQFEYSNTEILKKIDELLQIKV